MTLCGPFGRVHPPRVVARNQKARLAAALLQGFVKNANPRDGWIVRANSTRSVPATSVKIKEIVSRPDRAACQSLFAAGFGGGCRTYRAVKRRFRHIARPGNDRYRFSLDAMRMTGMFQPVPALSRTDWHPVGRSFEMCNTLHGSDLICYILTRWIGRKGTNR